MSRPRGVVILVTAVVALTGCGDETSPPHEIPSPGSTAPVILQFQTGGGISGPCCDPWEVPDITAYRDGRVVYADGLSGQLPVLREAAVGRSELDELVAEARDGGLMEVSWLGALCCDLAYTNVALADGLGTNELEVVGLGNEDQANSDLSDEQIRQRRVVADLQERLTALAEQSTNQREYSPGSVAIYPRPASDQAGAQASQWPLAGSLAWIADYEDGCLVVGTEAKNLVTAAARENSSGLWSSDGREWVVSIRPLLPYEEGCPPRVVR